NYPNNQFPSKEYWQYVGDEMAQKFKDTGPGGIWIVSLYQSNGDTRLNFPVQGAPFGHVLATASDQNDDYLAYFDNTGLKVWLQVEPGLANVDTLIHIILNRYKHHPSVAGFGVDVEWYGVPQHSGGKKLDDQTPQHWEQKVKAVNPEYTLFLKHYSKSWMPPNYRGNIIFVDDSQDFTFSAEPFNAMISEFSAWGTKFYPNKVAFQYGYPKDRSWWSQLNDPPGDIGKALIKNIPNCSGLFWVDFTVTEVFPPGQIP
ncbi:MAG: hypothetical protein ACE5GL_04560, partial [Calditrichia bacterium]